MFFLIAAPAQAKYGGGTGEPNDPYLIYDANHMQAIGADANDWDKCFKLMADINLSAYTGTSFNTIGVYLGYNDPGNNPFTGIFDGNGHTISNFTYTSTATNYIGLFAYISGENAEIKNLGLIDANIDAGTGSYVGSLVGRNSGTITNCYAEGGSVTGSFSVGGLVGYNNDGTISNCYSTGSVSGNYYVGGLVGVNHGTITNCSSEGDVSGNEYVGGLVGENWEGTISNCYSTGSVSGPDWAWWYGGVGGLVGHNFYGTITNCYSTGSVTGDRWVGGLVGTNGGVRCEMEWCWVVPGTISNCYSSGSVAGGSSVGGLVGGNYGTVSNCYATGNVTGNIDVGGLVGYNGGVLCGEWYCWAVPGTISNCYSTGSVTGTTNFGGLVGGYEGEVLASFWDTQTSGQTTSYGGTGLPTTEMQTASTFIAWGCEPVWMIDEGNDYPRLLWENMPGEPITTPSYGGGSGEPNDPYLIYTAEQLNTIGLIRCDWDRHFKLMGDIDLAGFTGMSFNIIRGFTGVFDGSGHTISNFTYDSNGVDFIGLFGYVNGENAEIKNLGLIDPNVDAGTGAFVGSLVGQLRDGTITNCYVDGGSVAGDWDVGGLAGYNWGGTITDCYSTGDVSGTGVVGGLVGWNHSGTITNCYSTGDVSGLDSVGGLVGTNGGTITNCYVEDGSVSGSGSWLGGGVGGLVGLNGGTITNSYSQGSASGDYAVGGLVGKNGWCHWEWCYSGMVSNCYSTGSVSGNDSVGGLVGENTWCDMWETCYEGEVWASFWDTETSGQTTSYGGTGKTTAEMQMAGTFTDAGWDFTTPVWTIDEGVDYPRLWWEFEPVLHAEPEVTLGTSNTISWDPVVSGIDYFAECAEDADFTSIVYNSGWITETSCEFTGLKLGKRYWYSVKARNAAGTDSQWSNVESSLQCTLADAVEMMLDPESLKNENMKNALLNKIDAALKMIEEANYTGALSKLRNDILTKTNGCTETGQPDKNDWIITCEEQSNVYSLIIETIEHVRSLMP